MNVAHSDTTSDYSNEPSAKKNIQQIRPWLYRPKKSKFSLRRTYKYNEKHWNLEQNLKYAAFLTQYIDLVKSDANKKRQYHLNRMASKFVGTRSPTQCRSHHQRMMKAYGTLQNVIEQLTKISRAQFVKSENTVEIESAPLKQQQGIRAMDEVDFLLMKTKETDSEISMELLDSEDMLLNNFFDL